MKEHAVFTHVGYFGVLLFYCKKEQQGWLRICFGCLRAIAQNILLFSPSGLMIQSSLFMELVKRAVEGEANLYLHFSVICKVSNGKNDFAVKVSKHKQFPSMEKLELYLLVQFSFLFLHLDGRSLLPCFPEGNRE